MMGLVILCRGCFSVRMCGVCGEEGGWLTHGEFPGSTLMYGTQHCDSNPHKGHTPWCRDKTLDNESHSVINVTGMCISINQLDAI